MKQLTKLKEREPPLALANCSMRNKLTIEQANEIEAEMRHLETDPSVTKLALRLYMQSTMPCGHAIGNLLTCLDPPFGCVICGEPNESGVVKVL